MVVKNTDICRMGSEFRSWVNHIQTMSSITSDLYREAPTYSMEFSIHITTIWKWMFQILMCGRELDERSIESYSLSQPF